MLTARRFTSRATASTLERLEAAIANVRPIGLRETDRSAVRAIQSALADLSEVYLLQEQVDGLFGPRTGAAVGAFQRDYGLYSDGFVGRQTMTQLDVIYSGDVIRAPVGMSLHVGVNIVDSAHYGDQVAKLASCVNDANAMLSLAERIGYAGSVVADEDATVANVTAGIRSAADALFSGDVFLFSYSGHGGQIPNASSDDEPDGMDETLCLYDRMFVDDELYMLLSEFRAGVRVFLVFDSCHSATAAKGKQLVEVGRKAIKDVKVADLEDSLKRVDVDFATVPITKQLVAAGDDKDGKKIPAVEVRSAEPLSKEQLDAALNDELNTDDLKPQDPVDLTDQSKEIVELFADLEADAAEGSSKLLLPWESPYKDHESLYDTVRNVVGPKEMAALEAKVESLAACLDSQTTLAGNVLSEFTSNLIAAWDDGNYDGNSEQLIARIKQFGSYNDAIPTLMTYGRGGSALAYERPFAV